MTRVKGRRPRVVLDTNVVLSALLFARGPAALLRGAWQHGDFVPLVSTATTRELIRVLTYPKFRLDAIEQQELLSDYLPHAQVVAIPTPLPRVPACRDANDLPFLHLAVAGRAAILVSSDADFLALAGATPFAIQSLSAFTESLRPAS